MTAAENGASVVAHHLRELHEEGITVIRDGFEPGLIDRVLNGVGDFIARNENIFGRHKDADGHYPRIINMHLAHKQLLELFCGNPISLAVQDGFFGRESSLYTSLYYERGSAQPIHRDTPYFCTKPEYHYLGVWVALEDANDENGCLEIFRYGHKVPELDREALAKEVFGELSSIPSSSQLLWDKYQDQVTTACIQTGLAPERIHAKAGDVVIWHPQLPHGGSAIKDISRTRHSLVMHVTPVGVPVYHHDVFFNPGKVVSHNSPWRFESWGSRKFAVHGTVEFGHQDPQPPTAFR